MDADFCPYAVIRCCCRYRGRRTYPRHDVEFGVWLPAGSFGANAVAAGQGVRTRCAGRIELSLVSMRVATNTRNEPGAQFVSSPRARSISVPKGKLRLPSRSVPDMLRCGYLTKASSSRM